MTRVINSCLGFALASLLTSSATAQFSRSEFIGPARASTYLADAPAAAKLQGLSRAEADALIVRLQNLQKRLRAGVFVSTELLSGGTGSDPMTQVAPRQAFLEMQFDQSFEIRRLPPQIPLRQAYTFTVAPDGLGNPMWFVEIDLGASGHIERVEMLHKAPAPF